ncbi:hypothetical protein ACHAQA_000409 [Verticillium albo-atrum]
MYNFSTSPLPEWITNLPPDSPYNMLFGFLGAFATIYFVVATIFGCIYFSEQYAARYTTIAGDPADTHLTRALRLGLWLDGCILIVVAVLLSPLALLALMAAAPLVALWTTGRGALKRYVAGRRRSGKGVVEMLLLDIESPVQIGALAVVIGVVIISQWWTT